MQGGVGCRRCCLNASKELRFKVNQRGVRERFTLLQTKYKQKNRADEQSSGTSAEITELDVLLEEIGEKGHAAEEEMTVNNNKKKMEIDRAKTEEMRKMAMKQVGETTKRKNDEGDDQKKTEKDKEKWGRYFGLSEGKVKDRERLEGKGARD